MRPQVVDAVVIVDGAVRLYGIHRAQTVLHDEHGLFVPVVDGVQGHPQAHRVDGPAPLAGFQVGVFHRGRHGVAVCVLRCQQFFVHRDAAAGIVAEGHKIHRALLQRAVVLRLGVQLHPGALHPLFRPHGVRAAHLHVGKEVVVPVGLLRRPHILRGAGAGVELPCCQHTAHHGIRHFFVRQLYRLCAGHQLVMSGLILDLLHILAGVEHQPCAGKGEMQQHIDLVEGKPVLHLALEAVEQHLAVVDVSIHHAAVLPAAVFFDQGNGGIKVADGDQRLDAVLMALVKNAVVEGKPRLVGPGVIAVGQDAGPRNGQPEALETHLRKQSDIFFIMVIQVNGLVAGVEMRVVAVQHFHIARCHRKTIRAKGGHIHRGKPLAVCLPCALALIGGGSTAPQKTFGKAAHTLYLLICSVPLCGARVLLRFYNI